MSQVGNGNSHRVKPGPACKDFEPIPSLARPPKQLTHYNGTPTKIEISKCICKMRIDCSIEYTSPLKTVVDHGKEPLNLRRYLSASRLISSLFYLIIL